MATALRDLLSGDALKPTNLLGIAVVLLILWQIETIIYNVFFHPLRHFPGPVAQGATPLIWGWQVVRGRQPRATQRLHDKYGPVVRIAPGHLSFTDARAWKDIYGHLIGHKSGQQEMAKSVHFSKAIDSLPHSILSAPKDEHQRLRRALSHGFSDAAMRQQVPMIVRHVDLLMQRFHELCEGGKKAINSEAWYNFTTFDIAGDLIFGQEFGCLQGSHYHPWIEFIFKTIRWGTTMGVLDYLGFVGHWIVQFIFRYAAAAFKQTTIYTEAMVANRLAMKEGRGDLFEGLVSRQEEWDLSFQHLAANAFILVLAGSETTATTLSGVTYLLLENPHVLERLTKEVRSSFRSADEIDLTSVNKLSYMLAVLNEALRMYPPVTATLIRRVPTGGAQIAGHFVAEGTYVEVQHWSMNHSKENWTDPWTFDPERFLDTSAKKNRGDKGYNNLEALQAFSAGPRNCIGRNLAYAEMRLILARVIYDFDLKLADDSRDWIARQKTFTLWDRIPLNVYLTPVVKA